MFHNNFLLRIQISSEVIFHKLKSKKDIFGFLGVFDEIAEEEMRCISNSLDSER